jgi:hypothetical protein
METQTIIKSTIEYVTVLLLFWEGELWFKFEMLEMIGETLTLKNLIWITPVVIRPTEIM